MALQMRAEAIVPAPLDLCWERLLDVDTLLARVPHKRVAVTRVAGAGVADIGSAWQVGLNFAGRDHEGRLEITELAPPESCRLQGGTQSLKLDLGIAMAARSADVSDLLVTVELAALTLSGRVMLKPLQVMKPALEGRFRDRVAWVVTQMMDDV